MCVCDWELWPVSNRCMCVFVFVLQVYIKDLWFCPLPSLYDGPHTAAEVRANTSQPQSHTVNEPHIQEVLQMQIRESHVARNNLRHTHNSKLRLSK